METVYIETSVVSYLVASPSRNPVTAWRQRLTRQWWTERRGQFACVISEEVLAEAGAGDAGMSAARQRALRDLPLISGGPQSEALADDLLAAGLFPPNARADASHLATATCAGVDYLLTWNYRHLANAMILRGVERFLAHRGLRLPQVCTPEELMGE